MWCRSRSCSVGSCLRLSNIRSRVAWLCAIFAALTKSDTYAPTLTPSPLMSCFRLLGFSIRIPVAFLRVIPLDLLPRFTNLLHHHEAVVLLDDPFDLG